MSESPANPASQPAAQPSGDRVIEMLEPRQKLFVREYLVDCSAGKAALRLGLDRALGYRMLAEPLVQLAIEEEQEDRRRRLAVTADRVVRELAAIAFSDITDYVELDRRRVTFRNLNEIPPERRRAIAELKDQRTNRTHTITFKLHDKMKALTKLCDHLGIAVQRTILQGDAAGGPVRTQSMPLPPQPQTIEEWEEQVRRANQRALHQSGTVTNSNSAGTGEGEPAEPAEAVEAAEAGEGDE